MTTPARHAGMFGNLQPAPTTIPEVLERLVALQKHLERSAPLRRYDGLACFNYLYHVITKDVHQQVEADRFGDRKFVVDLDIAFANRYLDALRAYAEGRHTPRSWGLLLDRRSHPGISALQFAVAGVNAHVNFDLPLALVTTCSHLRVPLNHGSQRADYQVINRIFAVHMGQLRQHFETYLERSLDGHVASLANRAGDVVVIVARDAAWLNASVLWPSRNNRAFHRLVSSTLDATTSLGALIMLTPLGRPHDSGAAPEP